MLFRSIDSGSSEAGPLAVAVREMSTALGLSLGSVAKVDDDELAAANAKAAALDAARAAKDFAKADALRAELQAAGWLVETTKQGTTLRRA